MKIKKISFNGDEIFKNLTIDFMNPKTNSPFSTIIIIGENGAGKSNLLKSLSKSDLFRVPQSNGNKIEYEEQQHQNYPVFLNNENINNNNIHSEPKLEFGKKENIKYDVTEILKSFLEQAAFNTYEIINKSPEVINRDELLNEGAKNIKYIQKILNDFFEDDGLKFTDKYSKTTSIQFLKNNVELTYNVLSDGEKKILTNVAKILSCGDSISSTPILIDEPEEKLHFI
jgi:predicted ATP-binding protein involved in virulence